MSSSCQLVNITEKDVYQLLHEYRIHSAEVLFREDCTIDQFIDVIEGNRKYVRCLYVYNKIDMTSIEVRDRVRDRVRVRVRDRIRVRVTVTYTTRST